ncbi:MAG TPA: TlpA disulfide reductase family protein [Pseudosphingobacterium sp.]|nr:TlpA disulfide reductase family protein [Pseudosphingobacterium sp.]
MKVYDFIGTLLFKNKLFKHNWQKKRKLNQLLVFGQIMRFLHSPRTYSLPSVEMTGKRKICVTKRLGSYVLSLATIKILFCVCLAHAGQRGVGNPVATGVALSADSIKPLQIGDTIPSALWNMPLQLVKAGQEGSTTVTLNDYKGKLIILDFWATWCGSCIASMPKMDSLQKEFNEITVLPLTYQDTQTASAFLNKNHKLKNLNLGYIVNDTIFKRLFPHKLIPHLIWIDQQRKVLGITGAADASRSVIKKLLTNQPYTFHTKNDLLSYDRKKPLFIDGNGGEDTSFSFRSVLSGYLEGIPSAITNAYELKGKIYVRATNVPIFFLYNLIMPQVANYPTNRIVFERAEADKFLSSCSTLPIDEWNRKNLYTYDLTIPAHRKDDLKRIIEADLLKYFGVQVKEQELEMRVYKLISLKNAPSKPVDPQSLDLNRDFHGGLLTNFLGWLNNIQGLPPVVSDLTKNIPLDIKIKRSNNINDLNKQLKSYHLQLIEEEQIMKVLVVMAAKK